MNRIEVPDMGGRFGGNMPGRSNRSGSVKRSSPSYKFSVKANTTARGRAESDRWDRDVSVDVVAAEGQTNIDALRRSNSRISEGIELVPLDDDGSLGAEEAYRNPMWTMESRQVNAEHGASADQGPAGGGGQTESDVASTRRRTVQWLSEVLNGQQPPKGTDAVVEVGVGYPGTRVSSDQKDSIVETQVS